MCRLIIYPPTVNHSIKKILQWFDMDIIERYFLIRLCCAKHNLIIPLDIWKEILLKMITVEYKPATNLSKWFKLYINDSYQAIKNPITIYDDVFSSFYNLPSQDITFFKMNLPIRKDGSFFLSVFGNVLFGIKKLEFDSMELIMNNPVYDTRAYNIGKKDIIEYTIGDETFFIFNPLPLTITQGKTLIYLYINSASPLGGLSVAPRNSSTWFLSKPEKVNVDPVKDLDVKEKVTKCTFLYGLLNSKLDFAFNNFY